jgi:hypothetical protein
LGNPAAPPSLWNLFRAKESSKKIEKSGWRDSNRSLQMRKKEKPIPDEEDGSSMTV